jgi:hypothetical protein
MTTETAVAAKLWPAEAEMLSEDDWNRLSTLASQDHVVTSQDLLEPLGEAKDGLLAALMILYWTLKLTQAVIQISKEISGVSGKSKVEAIITAVNKRMNPDTPKMVRDRLTDIIDELHEG